MRRLVFLTNQTVIQTEVRLLRRERAGQPKAAAKAKKGGKAAKKAAPKRPADGVEWEFDHR
jgi:hypothetical protein